MIKIIRVNAKKKSSQLLNLEWNTLMETSLKVKTM